LCSREGVTETTAVSAAVALAVQGRPDLELDPENPEVARGSVADVFRFRDRSSEGNAIAFKTVPSARGPR
jgi:hypothetical protein